MAFDAALIIRLGSDALRIALRDRKITRDEEVRLHRLADELGIAPSRAHQILVDVEREVRS